MYFKHGAASCCISNCIEFGTIKIREVFSCPISKKADIFAAHSKLIANFATRTLKNLENGKDNSPKYRDNGFVT
jgi:hypothetical protein